MNCPTLIWCLSHFKNVGSCKFVFVLTGEYLDIIAVSCDSFNPETNATIGRQQGRKDHLKSLHKVQNWCQKYKVCKYIHGLGVNIINVINI